MVTPAQQPEPFTASVSIRNSDQGLIMGNGTVGSPNQTSVPIPHQNNTKITQQAAAVGIFLLHFIDIIAKRIDLNGTWAIFGRNIGTDRDRARNQGCA